MATGTGIFPTMHPVAGFRLGTASAGIKTQGRPDLVVMEIPANSTVAGLFTQNAFCAAPVTLCKQHLAAVSPRYFLTNTGNANAGTGDQGMTDALRSCEALASAAGVEPNQVMPFSTGVIGEPLPMDRLLAGIPNALANLSEQGWAEAATGILTTDTRPKGASLIYDAAGAAVTITGISKGSGMIKPNMATMLGFVGCDANISQALLAVMVKEIADESFNRITVDGDTSTNDCFMVCATAQSKAAAIVSQDDLAYQQLRQGLTEVAQILAQAIVRDGEGATKFVTVQVTGGASAQECLEVAYTVAESPLVKTALFAGDANWGRFCMAIGRAAVVDLDVANVALWLNEVEVASGGLMSSTYTEAAGAGVLAQDEFSVIIDLGRGRASETIWTTDLSYEYVRINAEYRS